MKLIIEKYGGEVAYHTDVTPTTVLFEEGRHMIKIYDTRGSTEFVAAYNTTDVESIHWDR